MKKKSTRSKGAYYLTKSKNYYKKLGWKVEKMEVAIPFFIGGRAIFSRRDLLGADLFIWNDVDCALVQVKFGEARSISTMKGEATRQFAEHNVPLKKIIMIWQPKQKPLIFDL